MKLSIVIYLLFILFYKCHFIFADEKYINATFNETYNLIISENNSTKLAYYYKRQNLTQAIRIFGSSKKASIDFPALVVIRLQRSIGSFQIPVIVSNKEKNFFYPFVSQTLCPDSAIGTISLNESTSLFIEVASAAPDSEAFDVDIHANWISTENFVLSLSNDTEVTLRPPEPQFFQFNFPPNSYSVDVRVISDSDNCMIFSIQEVKCPVYDEENNVENRGMFQTVTNKGLITVERTSFGSDQFFVVLILLSDDERCNNIQEALVPVPAINSTTTQIHHFLSGSRKETWIEREKNVTIRVEATISAQKYLLPLAFAIILYSFFFIISFLIVLLVYFRQNKKIDFVNTEDPVNTSVADELPPMSSDVTDRQNEQIDNRNFNSLRENQPTISAPNRHNGNAVPFTSLREILIPRKTPGQRTSRMIDVAEEIDEADIDTLDDAGTDLEVIFMQRSVYVTDLSKKKTTSLVKKYDMYRWYLIIIAIFYGLPVIQLVITYQKMFSSTGNQDTCFYNFYCARPLFVFTAFNNVYSNIGYVLLGALFVFLTWRRSRIHQFQCAVNQDSENGKEYGVPQHFGIFYAMGIALMVEGLMSACYHVCPSYNNFQFDTAFMYILACLTILKIYEIRHPDINAAAHVSYMMIAIVIMLGVIGVVYINFVFWIFFTLALILISVLLTAEIYYLGRWELNFGLFKRFYNRIRSEGRHFFKPSFPYRMILLVIANIVNFIFAIYGVVFQPSDFSSYLLFIFMTNLFMYFVFYILMKWKHGERMLFFPMFYSISSLIVWGFSLYFFMQPANSWEKTASKSREMNKDCILLDFYDLHDIWHFLSSIAMFLSFMILLTMDDDLVNVPRNKINVF